MSQIIEAKRKLKETGSVQKTTPPLSMPAYGTLIANKVVVPSVNSNYFAVDQHFFFQLAMPHIASIEFDEVWYLATYSDIRDAIAAGAVSSAHHHYLRYGFYEHRLPRKIEVDEVWYLDVHKDVRDAIAHRHYSSGQEHYLLAGFREGRLPYAGFSLAAGLTAP
jgi:hypothetical protein